MEKQKPQEVKITKNDFKVVERDGGWGYAVSVEFYREFANLKDAKGALEELFKKKT